MFNTDAIVFFFIFCTSLLISLSVTPSLIKLAIRLDILDYPVQNHKTHHESVPYLGGLSIIIPVVLISTIGALTIPSTETLQRLLILIIPSLIMAMVGLWDDIRNLSASLRLLVQFGTSIIVSILLVQNGFSVSISANNLVNVGISIFWIVGVSNALNFIDNIDGGAAGVSFVASFAIFVLSISGRQYLIAMLTLCICGAVLGFLYWNSHPARIYLGDCGALFLGVVFAVLMIQFEPRSNGEMTSILIPIFVMSVPILDVSVAVTSRIMRKVSPFQGGKDHLAHRLQRIGYSRKIAALALWLIEVFFCCISLAINFSKGETRDLLAFFGLGSLTLLYLTFVKLPFDGKKNF